METHDLEVTVLSLFFLYWFVIYFTYTRGEGGLRPPSPLVWVAGATLISSEEVV